MQDLTSRKFRILLVVLLVILTVQGWIGGVVNIFIAPSSGVPPPPSSISGFLSEVDSLGISLIFHTAEGIFLFALAIAAFVLSFVWSKSRGVRIASGLGALFVIFAALGGIEFVMSGFSNGGNSAQMDGSFIGSYAFFFIALYYSRAFASSKTNSPKTSEAIVAETRGGNAV
jgi:heme A synthase